MHLWLVDITAALAQIQGNNSWKQNQSNRAAATKTERSKVNHKGKQTDDTPHLQTAYLKNGYCITVVAKKNSSHSIKVLFALKCMEGWLLLCVYAASLGTMQACLSVLGSGGGCAVCAA